MAIQVHQVKGDTIELIFDPREGDLRVGENLCLKQKTGKGGLVVQVVEFRMVTYPSLIKEQLCLVLEDAQPLSPELVENLAEAAAIEPSEARNLKVAVAKVRKLSGIRWDRWNGWIPTRDVEIKRVEDKELFANCIEDCGHPLYLGRTLQGKPFWIEGRSLEKVNIITGVKGSGKSHLAKALLLRLIDHRAPCVVFDINKEYIHLPKHKVDRATGEVFQRGIVHLRAGENLKLSVRQFGLGPLLTMLSRFGLPETSAVYFENRMARLLAEADSLQARGKRPPFLGIRELIQLAEEGEFGPSEVVNAAIRSRLEAVRNTGIFASGPEEAASLYNQYSRIHGGGALIIDISGLSNLARFGFVQALIEIIRDICEAEIGLGTGCFPFIFFEEAHLYISRNTIGYIVTRARHLGMTSFFVTNMISGLDEAVLRQADNLFLLHLPFDDDVRHISKSALTDQETMASFIRRLRHHHALVLGEVTGQYPIIIRVDPLQGVNTAGETQFFFKPKEGNSQRVLPFPERGE